MKKPGRHARDRDEQFDQPIESARSDATNSGPLERSLAANEGTTGAETMSGEQRVPAWDALQQACEATAATSADHQTEEAEPLVETLTYESLASWTDVLVARGEHSGADVESVHPKPQPVAHAPAEPVVAVPASAGHGRPERRRRRVAVLAALSTAFVGFGMSQVWAAPDRVLQDVQVQLSGDGSVKEIKNVVIRRSSDDDTSSDESSVDPAQWGSHLPVRIQTTYQLDDAAGTNLDDLKGKSGTAVIELTVQNLTAKPTELTSGSTQMALVGTPMTVVASAKLGKSGLSRVITKRPVAGPVTNGSLGSADGNDVVQWAALLVPPKLSPSATFRLVLSGKKLQVPEFNISVQPRLLADSSMSEVLTSAFDPQSKSSSVALQIATVNEIGNVNKALDDATEGLGEIQTQLNDSANTLGRQTYQDLLNGTKNLTSQMKDVGSQLDDTQSGLTEGLSQTQSTLSSTLSSSIGTLQKTLGDPNKQADPTAGPVVAGCANTPTWTYPDMDHLSVFQHIRLAQKQLEALTNAAQVDCVNAIKADLNASIGDLGSPCAQADSAMCAIDKAKTSVTDTLTAFDSGKTDATAALNDSPFTQLKGHVHDFRNLANGDFAAHAHAWESDSPDVISALHDDLIAVSAKIDPLKSALDALGLNDIFDVLQSLESANVPDADKLLDLIGDVCGSNESAVTQIIDDLNLGGDCTDELEGALDANGTLDDLKDDASALPSESQLQSKLSNFGDLLHDTQNDIDAVQQALDDDSADLDSLLSQVEGDLNDLDGLASHISSVTDNDISDEFQSVQDKVNDAFGQVDAIRGTPADLETRKSNLAGALDHAVGINGNLDQFVQGLDGVQAKNAANKTALDKAVTKGNADLGKLSKTLKGSLDQGVTDSVNSINDGLSSSSKDVDDTRKQLLDDLNAVLTGIGSPNNKGTGLIGVLLQNAGVTEDQATSLDGANDAAKRFSNVQAANREQALLEWRQLEQALAEQNNFPPFAVDAAPANSLSVFSFRLGQE